MKVLMDMIMSRVSVCFVCSVLLFLSVLFLDKMIRIVSKKLLHE